MSNQPDAMRGAGEDGHGEGSLSGRARARHYRHYAAEIRAIAEAKRAGPIRDQLMMLARQYEALARIVGGTRNPRPAASVAAGRRRPRRRKPTPEAALS
jgi:hypothetical protein